MNKNLKRILTLCISLLLIILAITTAFAGTAIDEIDCQRRAKLYSNEYAVKPFGDYEKGFFTHNLMGSPKLLSMFYNKSRNIYMYCIEPGAPAHSGSIKASDELQTCEFWNNLSKMKQDNLKILLLYGFPNVNYPDLCDCDEYAATQALIWELMGKPNAINIHESDHARAAYDRLKAKLNNFDIKPSFSNTTVKLKWNGSKYTGSLTDTNNILSEFPVISADGINISQSGNILNFSTSAPLKSTVQSSKSKKNIPSTNSTLYLFYAADQQTMISGTGRVDPPSYNLKFETDHGTMKIIKKSDSGNVSGWEFKITGKGINKTVKTGKDGIISVDLPVQEYTVEEINLPSYMKKPAPQKITVKYHQTASVSFENKYKEGKVQVIKVDKETNKPIETTDAVFEAMTKNSDGKWQSLGNLKYNPTLKLYETGNIKITEHNGGTVRIYERKAPTGYVKNTNDFFDAKLTKDGEVQKITFANSPQKGKIRIVKTGEVFSSVETTENSDGQKVYAPIFTEKPLKDAVYGIYAKEDIYLNGELKHKKDAEIARITTDENGTAEQDNLYLGKMYIKEIKAPDGYILNPEPQEVELTYNGEAKETVSNISFSNKRQKFEISLLKEMEKDKEANLGSNGEILNVVFGLYAAEEFTAADGKIIPKDALIETGSPDKNGTLKFTADLPQGKVYVKEISTDKAYVLDGEKYDITLKHNGQTIKVIPVFANGEKPILNKLKSGTLEITKKDISDGKLLPDTGFRIYDENGKIVSEGKTDKNGIAKFSLKCGKYTYQEFEAPKGYLIDEKEYPFEITEDGQIVKAEMKNKKIPENPKPVIPKTGKLEKSAKIQISVYLSVGVLSAAAVLVFYLRKKKDEG